MSLIYQYIQCKSKQRGRNVATVPGHTARPSSDGSLRAEQPFPGNDPSHPRKSCAILTLAFLIIADYRGSQAHSHMGHLWAMRHVLFSRHFQLHDLCFSHLTLFLPSLGTFSLLLHSVDIRPQKSLPCHQHLLVLVIF